MNEPTYSKIEREFYTNLTHYKDTLQMHVQGIVITITPELIREILDLLVEGLTLRKKMDALKPENILHATFALPKNYIGEKVLTYMDYTNRRLHYALVQSLLHKANAPNLVSNTEHYIMQYIVKHKPVNFPIIVIHHMRKPRWSMGGLISLIIKNKKIDIGYCENGRHEDHQEHIRWPNIWKRVR